MSSKKCNLPTPRGYVGFEFDLNYSIKNDYPLINPDRSKPYNIRILFNNLSDGTDLSSHDGYEFKIDGNRIELSTEPFNLDRAGKVKFEKVFAEIIKQIENNLMNQYEIRSGSKERFKIKRAIKDEGEFGKASVLGLYLGGEWLRPQRPTTPGGFWYAIARPVFPLNRGGNQPYFSKDTTVYGAPQATLTLPLGKIPHLVEEIKKHVGNKPGFSWSGGEGKRLGLKSDALFQAYLAVTDDRKKLIKEGKVISTSTGENIILTEKTFSDELYGFLVLVVQYLRINTLKYGARDYELFAKAYIPLHLKSPFQAIYQCILSTADKEIFLSLYGNGNADIRKNLYRLAGKGEDAISDSFTKLFPEQTHENQKRFLHQPFDSGNFTWAEFIDMIINNMPIHLRSPDGFGKVHRETQHNLFNALTKQIGPNENGKGEKLIVVEMRRLAMGWVHYKNWKLLCQNIYEIASKLNA